MATTYTQAGRPISVATPLGPDALLLRAVRGVEAVSAPFRFELDLLAPESTDVPFDKLLDQPATVTLLAKDLAPRYLNGVVGEFEDLGPVAGGPLRLTRYRAVLVPAFALLEHTVQSRTFQQMAVPDILKAVLAGVDYTFSPQAAYKPRNYCVQYRESDFAFASRLMEEEGIRYAFQHADGKHTMVLSDAPLVSPKIAGEEAVAFDTSGGGARADERVWSWAKAQRLGPAKYTHTDYHFETPDNSLLVTASVPPEVNAGSVRHKLTPGGSAAWEALEHPGRYAQRFDGVGPGGADQSADLPGVMPDGQRTITVRAQAGAAARLTARGTGAVRRFAAGAKFKLERLGKHDGEYVLTRVEHAADLGDVYTTGAVPDGPLYSNRFEAIPAGLPLRPARVTPRPRAYGVYPAKVVGPPGEQIYCDKYGRVKILFPWDRNAQPNPAASCWVRVAQPSSGGGWGAVTLPRVGQEVVVTYKDGDPDHPLILGAVYNGTNMPPYELPKYRTHSGLKTQSRGGGTENFSGLTFEDYLGQEHVHLHAERHMSHTAEQHFVQNVGGQHHLTVAGGSTRQVGGLPGLNAALNIGPHGVIGSTSSSSGGSGAGAGRPVGALPRGSGLGGSDETPSQQEVAQDTDGPYFYAPAALTTGPASHIDMVFGYHTSNTVGLYSTLKFGTNVSNTFNPLAVVDLVGDFGGFSTLVAAMGVLGGNVMGASSVTIGSNTALTYGRSVSASHGPQFSYTPTASNKMYIATGILGGLYSLAVIGEMFLPMATADIKSSSAQAGVGAGYELASLALLNAWAAVEVGLQGTLLAKRVSDAAASTVGSAPHAPVVLNAQHQVVNTALIQVQNAVDDGGVASGAETESAEVCHQFDVAYTLAGPMITLLSAPGPDEETSGGIVLQATGLDGTDGEVLVLGSGQATLMGGDMAYVQCQTEEETIGLVTVDCGPDGTISLQSGLAKEPNNIILSPEGISIESLEEITSTVEENVVSMTPAGISLTSAESAIEITPEGITITCGPCSVCVTPEGVVINGVTVELAGDAAVSVSGAVVEIGP